MTATYDPLLPTDLDWVRFLIGDRNTASPALQNEEILACLVEKGQNKYLAAALAGNAILAKGRGVISKSVGDLSLSFGDSPTATYRSHLQRLQERGAELLLKQSGSSVLRVL
jgi:hypothetical protein